MKIDPLNGPPVDGALWRSQLWVREGQCGMKAAPVQSLDRSRLSWACLASCGALLFNLETAVDRL